MKTFRDLFKDYRFRFSFIVLVTILTLAFLSNFSPYDPTLWNVVPKNLKPSPNYIFGTDSNGQDIFWQATYAVRNSLIIALIAGLVSRVIAILVGMVAGFVGIIRTKPGERAMDVFFLHFFVINNIIKKINLARFARILSSLLKSGIPIVQGLEVAGNSLGNIPYRELVLSASQDVKVGKSLTESLSKNETLFPVLVVQMIEVGEESGTVQEILEQLAVHYEEEVDNILTNLSSVIEPLLLLFIGGVVGFLAMALIAPIYNIGQNIK